MDLTCQLGVVESIPLAGAEARWPADFVVVTVPLAVLTIDLKREGNLRWGGMVHPACAGDPMWGSRVPRVAGRGWSKCMFILYEFAV